MSPQPLPEANQHPAGETSLLAKPHPSKPGIAEKQNGFCLKPPSLGLVCYTAIDSIHTDLSSDFNSALANCVTAGIIF